MNVIDLFAGAGGLSEGFRKAGFNILSHVEMDQSASLTLKTREAFYYLKEHHMLNVYEDYLLKKISRDELYSYIPKKILDRVINTEINDATIEEVFQSIDKNIENKEVSVIIGGPPCQAYSLAGRSRDPQRMKNDPRNYLYKQYIKFLNRFSPKIFVFENVMGILTAQSGDIFRNIKKEMNEAGYEIDYRVLNSKDFGVCQSRKRVIIIGWKKEISFAYPDFNDIQARGITIRNLFADLPILKSGEAINERNGYNDFPNDYLVSNSIREKEWTVLSQHVSRPNREIDLNIYKYAVEKWDTFGRKIKYDELPKDWQTQKNTKSFLDRFKVIPYDDVSHTVVAHISKDGHYYIHPSKEQNRSISVREAARIQSFPDNYYFEDSRTAAFKQIGNAVPPLMAYHIAIILKQGEVN
ncbi:DNA cytosine methyltransferase [Listeria monocytogenes]|nr:DNA cytosine methyltransferase [Listeria monocytogenes]EAW7127350.1 DNA cytosine methyltransferase [Listeria monocytogenes]EAW7192065.1 DNA cytosine methyltransferase [Listeria monocytogenes]ECL0028425.1 DNA cytosine methyltransferase [Listeria monocytogenes]EDH0848881.1 DNA (cytosine-5-)-methyltransferase [Listeria monocytogenes]